MRLGRVSCCPSWPHRTAALWRCIVALRWQGPAESRDGREQQASPGRVRIGENAPHPVDQPSCSVNVGPALGISNGLPQRSRSRTAGIRWHLGGHGTVLPTSSGRGEEPPMIREPGAGLERARRSGVLRRESAMRRRRAKIEPGAPGSEWESIKWMAGVDAANGCPWDPSLMLVFYGLLRLIALLLSPVRAFARAARARAGKRTLQRRGAQALGPRWARRRGAAGLPAAKGSPAPPHPGERSRTDQP